MSLRAVSLMDAIKHLPTDPRLMQTSAYAGGLPAPEACRYFLEILDDKLELEAMRQQQRFAPVHHFMSHPTIPEMGPGGMHLYRGHPMAELSPMMVYLSQSQVESGLMLAQHGASSESILTRGWRYVVSLVTWLQSA